MSTGVSVSADGPCATVRLCPDRPGHPPTLDHDTLDALAEAMSEVESARSDVRVVVIAAAEPGKYFCVGANIEALSGLNASTIREWVRHGHEVFNRLAALPMPSIAAIDGYALGGGLELAMACDLVVATHRSRLGLPEARLGFVPGWGGTSRLPRRVGVGQARRLCLTAGRIPASEAVSIGLVDVCVEADELNRTLEKLVDSIDSGVPGAIASVKRLVDQDGNQTEPASEAIASVRCMEDPDTMRRIESFLASRRAQAPATPG